MFMYESQSNNPKLTNFGRGETTVQISGSIIKITPSRTMMYAFLWLQLGNEDAWIAAKCLPCFSPTVTRGLRVRSWKLYFETV